MAGNIVVATDGSDTAQRAVDLAARIAVGLGGRLAIVHVLMHGAPAEELERMAETEHLVRAAAKGAMPDVANVPGTMGGLFSAAPEATAKVRLLTVVGDEVVRRAAARASDLGADVAGEHVVQGDYAEEILNAAEREKAELLVVGRRGLGTFGRLLQGSVSQKIGLHAHCPVLTVP